MTSKSSYSVLLVLPVLSVLSCADQPAALTRRTVAAPTTLLQPATVAVTRAMAGTVRSTNVSTLSAKVIGNVVRVHVSEGDRVRAGQLLLEIDPREGRAQSGAANAAVAAAQANASLAETTYQRFAALRERKSVSQQELDDVKARRDAARAELDRVRASATQADTFLDYSFVRSPIDGIVTARFVDTGAQAAPGVPLLTIEDAGAFRVEATIPEDLVVRAGDKVTIEAGNAHVEGTVAHVQPSVDATTRSSLVKIDVGGAMRSGAYVRVLFPTGERAALTVPASAIARRGTLTSVFVVGSDNVARMRLITVGANSEVLSGLEPGERVVTDASKVEDGVVVS